MIYLDHNATTPVDERVLEAMLPYLGSFYGNPSALYRAGRAVRTAIDTARSQVAALAGCQPDDVVFTSGGTESNNLAVKGFAGNAGTCHIAVSAIEHPSIMQPVQTLEKQGCHLKVLDVDAQGRVEAERLRQQRSSGLDLLSVMLANNETGVIQDIPALAAICRESQVVFHTDAVQAVGKIPVHFARLGVQMMTLSSHKIYGPKGAGALLVSKDIKLKPMLEGGSQERALRAGTENVAAIIGFGRAAEIAQTELQQRSERMLHLRRLLQAGLQEIPGVVVFSNAAQRLPNTLQFGCQGQDGEMLLMQLDQLGFAVSSGSACSSGGGKPSPVLIAMGVDRSLARSAVRISLGAANTEAQVHKFIQALKSLLSSPGY